MPSDRAKLALLLAATALCLGTIFNAPSTTMNNPKMRVLAAPVRQFCKAPREAAAKACSADQNISEHRTQCTVLTTSMQRCERVVQRAFRDINLGGCTLQIKAVDLCEGEWCRNGSRAESCSEECSSVRESLSGCVKQQVSLTFRRNGLNEDGTPR